MRVSWRHDDQLGKDALPDMHDQSEKQYRTLSIVSAIMLMTVRCLTASVESQVTAQLYAANETSSRQPRMRTLCVAQYRMEEQLKDFAEGRSTQNLTIIYSDMHGLWGGITVTLSTDGAYERLERARGHIVPDMLRRTLTAAQIQEVIRLLLARRLWEQQTLLRTPLPDEVRATLTLRTGNLETSVWDLYNNLEKNDRIGRVRRLLLKLAKE